MSVDLPTHDFFADLVPAEEIREFRPDRVPLDIRSGWTPEDRAVIDLALRGFGWKHECDVEIQCGEGTEWERTENRPIYSHDWFPNDHGPGWTMATAILYSRLRYDTETATVREA